VDYQTGPELDRFWYTRPMDWGDALGMYGAVIGTGSMVVAGLALRAQVKSMRADDPDVHVWGSVVALSDGLGAYVSLTNKGRGEVTTPD
jgi:hypothetical protein